MAQAKIIIQGICEQHDHETALITLLNSTNVEKYLLSVAFARKSGIDLIADRLEQINNNVHFYIGIANGVTSLQAVQKLLDIGISPFLVDMGTNQAIYHPKIYAAFKEESVDVILGSANMTYSGLNQNIEASTVMRLDRSDPSDCECISTVEDNLFQLHINFPQHVIQVSTREEVNNLLQRGKLEDESIRRAASIIGHRGQGSNGNILPPFPVITNRYRTASIPTVQSAPRQAPRGIVWRSRELTERDLNIPTGNNTNRTGSMYFKKGLLNDVDQRHYFRDDVFAGLDWEYDPSPAKNHLERASANFELIIRGISYGTYHLRLTHNTLTNTPTYIQNNAMTQVHWHGVSHIVQDPSLLGAFMALYYLGGDNYQMAID